MAEVESVTRGLEILRLVNQCGGLSLAQVAARAGLSRGTAYRMLYTLEAEGLVERSEGTYSTTRRVLTLSHGFDDDWVDAARPHAWALGRDMLWPVTLSEYAAGAALVRETTDSESPFVFSATKVGFRMSMLGTASGRIMLSHVTDRQRSAILDQLDPPRPGAPIPNSHFNGELARLVRERGYDVLPTPCGRQTAIAVPVLNDAGEAVAALALRYFNAAMSHRQAIDKFLDPLRNCATHIGSAIESRQEPRH